MAVYCNLCGKENKDGNVICEFCGNMLVEFFSTSTGNHTKQDTPLQQKGLSKAEFEPNIEEQTVSPKPSSIQEKHQPLSDSSEYLFEIRYLIDIEKFVDIAEKCRNDSGLSDKEKDDILNELKMRAEFVFSKEISYYKKKGSFTSNLQNAVLCLILGAVLGAIFAPLGVICSLAMTYYVCKMIARLFSFPQSNSAARIVKKLQEAKIY